MIAEFVAAVTLAPVMETRLLAQPRVAEPGDVVSLVLENAEPRPLRYALPFRVQRLEQGEWRRVALRKVAIPHFGFRLPLLFLGPGERSDPLDLADGLPLSRSVRPGRYRLLRGVKVLRGPRLRIEAPFTVRR